MKWLLVILDILLLAALLILPAAWLLDPLTLPVGPLHLHVHWGLKPLLAPALLLAVRLLVRRLLRRRTALPPTALWERKGFRLTLSSLVAVYAFFGLTERLLIRRGFQAELPAVVFQGKPAQGGLENIPETIPDPELMFRLVPGTSFAGRSVNALGFREREVALHKPPGTIRVLCLGDSTTAQGLPAYADYLHERLTNAPPTPQPWEAFHIGVHSYSSLQGLRLFQRLGPQLQPDLVTIYFGWNDHWLWGTQTDRDRMAIRMSPGAGRVYDALKRKRFFQWLVVHFRRAPAPAAAGEDRRVLRVPPNDYVRVLTQLIAAIRAVGATPLLITAPHRPLQKWQVKTGAVRSLEEGDRLHLQYVDLTRRVARETGAELLDLEQRLAGPECDALFAQDGIHFDLYAAEPYLGRMAQPEEQPGLRRIAAELDRKIRELAPRLTRRATPPAH